MVVVIVRNVARSDAPTEIFFSVSPHHTSALPITHNTLEREVGGGGNTLGACEMPWYTHVHKS